MPKTSQNIRRYPIKRNGEIVRNAKGEPKLGKPQAVWQWVDKDGKRRTESKTFDSEVQAKRWLAQKLVDAGRADPELSPDACKATFSELVEGWKAARYDSLAPKTRARYDQILREHLEPRFGTQQVRTITRSVVGPYLLEAQTATSPGTAHKVKTTLSSILAEAVEAGMITTNPCHGINRSGQTLKPQPRKELDVLTEAEVWKLADTINPTYRALVITAAYSGLHQGELFALRRRDVDLKNGVIHVRKALKGWDDDGKPIFEDPKTKGSIRDVDMLDELAPVLADHLSPGGSPNDLVFTNSNGDPIKHRVFYPKNFVKARDKALPDHPTLTFHDLRHAFISWLLAAGVDLMTVAEQAASSNAAITAQVYAHAIPKQGGIKAALSKTKKPSPKPTEPANNVIPVSFGKQVL